MISLAQIMDRVDIFERSFRRDFCDVELTPGLEVEAIGRVKELEQWATDVTGTKHESQVQFNPITVRVWPRNHDANLVNVSIG